MKNNVTKSILIFLYVFTGCSCSQAYVPDKTYNEILSRLAEGVNEHPADSTAQYLLNWMSDDGTFSDIDYSLTSQEGERTWEPRWHLYRLVTISSAYANKDSRYYKDKEFLRKIELGINAWIVNSPRASNWWYGTIEVPYLFGCVLALTQSAGGTVKRTLVDEVLRVMHSASDSPYNHSDANRFDVALHWLYRSCLEKDEETLNVAVKCIFELLDVGETGFQVDGSFFHDGPQFFIGGYCVNSVLGVVGVASALRGSTFELVGERLDVLRKFFLETWISAARGGQINYDCYGRAISQEGIYYDIRASYKKMALIDPDYEKEYMKAISCLEGVNDNYKILHHHFFRGDYTTYTCPKYNFSVRMFSNRTHQLESGSGANLKGYFLCNGNTSITVTGKEYYDVCGFWDWNYIPGVTAPIIESVPAPKKNWGVIGTSDFAGGVSDSIYGVTTYSYYDDYNGMNTGGNKGWFFFGDEVVCLGSNIQSDHQAVTTIEQCWGHDDMSIFSVSDNACVVHHGIGYYFPTHSMDDLICRNELVSGNWHDINTSQKDSVINGQIFLLAINHDFSRHDGHQYAYIIVPGVSEKSMKDYIAQSEIEICANNDSMQVVRHKGLNIWEMVFYKPCTFLHANMKLTVSRPCAVLYKYDESGNPVVHVVDPAQKGEVIDIYFTDKAIEKTYSSQICYSDYPSEYYGMSMVASLVETTSGFSKELNDVDGGLAEPSAVYSIGGNKYDYPKKGVNIIKYKGSKQSKKMLLK